MRTFLVAIVCIVAAACAPTSEPVDSGLPALPDVGAAEVRHDAGPSARPDGGGFIRLDAGAPDGGPHPAQASATIGAEGGTLALGGAELTVPAGALTSPQTFTVSLLAEAVPSGYTAYSPLYSFEPSGITFPAPLVVTLPFDSRGDPRLASLFSSSATGSGYARLGGSVRSNAVSSSVTSLGRSFVADGADFDEAPDRSCARTRILEGRTRPPSQVAAYVAVEDCAGHALPGLTEQDFSVVEDGASVGAEAGLQVLDSSSQQAVLTLALDVSGADRERLLQIVGGAKALVYALLIERDLPVQIRVDLFAGDAEPTEWQPATLDPYVLLRRLNAVVGFRPAAPAATNLHGAVVDALARNRAAQEAYRARNFGGAFTAGYVVLFSRGPDTAGLRTREEALAAVESSPDAVFAVALESDDGAPRSELAALAPAGTIETPADANELWREFARVGARVASRLGGLYLLGYCSPQRSGQHRLEVSAQAATKQGGTFSFDAGQFTDGCRRATFKEICVDTDCGGLGCGACDDRLAACNPDTRECDNFCIGAGRCGGSITNPRGYPQDCSTTPNWTLCSPNLICIDFMTNSQNCGRCGQVCPYPSKTCIRGTCRCVAPALDCDGVCVDPDEDESHCGDCDTVCTANETCVEGRCQCAVDWCEGACTNLATDPRNCGTCGHDCGLGTCTTGICGPELLVTTPGGLGAGRAIAVDDTFIYFGNDATYRVTKAGLGLESLYVAPVTTSLTDVVLAGGRLFQAQVDAGNHAAIVEISLDGGLPSTVATGTGALYSYLRADATFLYGLFSPAVLKVPLGGGPATEAFRPAHTCFGFALDSAGLDWIDAGPVSASLMHLDALTSGTTELWSVASLPVGGLASDGTTLFWSTYGMQPTSCTLWSVPAAGGAPVVLDGATSCYREVLVVGDDLLLAGDGIFKMPKAGGAKVQLSTGMATAMAADASFVYFRLYGGNDSIYRVSRQ